MDYQPLLNELETLVGKVGSEKVLELLKNMNVVAGLERETALTKDNRRAVAEYIIIACCEVFELKRIEIMQSLAGDWGIKSDAIMVCCLLIRQLTKLSYNGVGKVMQRDKSYVFLKCKQMTALLKLKDYNKALLLKYEQVKAKTEVFTKILES